jgi:hypothetical protein
VERTPKNDVTNKKLWIALAVSLMGNGWLLMEGAAAGAALEKLERMEASAAKTDAEMLGSVRNFLASGSCPGYGCVEVHRLLALAQQAKEELAVTELKLARE